MKTRLFIYMYQVVQKNVTQQNGSKTMKNKDNHLKIAVYIAE